MSIPVSHLGIPKQNFLDTPYPNYTSVIDVLGGFHNFLVFPFRAYFHYSPHSHLLNFSWGVPHRHLSRCLESVSTYQPLLSRFLCVFLLYRYTPVSEIHCITTYQDKMYSLVRVILGGNILKIWRLTRIFPSLVFYYLPKKSFDLVCVIYRSYCTSKPRELKGAF